MRALNSLYLLQGSISYEQCGPSQVGRRIKSWCTDQRAVCINGMSTKDDGLSDGNFLPKCEMENVGRERERERRTIHHSCPKTLGRLSRPPSPAPQAFWREAGTAGAAALFLEHTILWLFLFCPSLFILKMRPCVWSLFSHLVSYVLVMVQK